MCITQLKAQGPSRTCNKRKEEEENYVLEHENYVLEQKLRFGARTNMFGTKICKPETPNPNPGAGWDQTRCAKDEPQILNLKPFTL